MLSEFFKNPRFLLIELVLPSLGTSRVRTDDSKDDDKDSFS